MESSPVWGDPSFRISALMGGAAFGRVAERRSLSDHPTCRAS